MKNTQETKCLNQIETKEGNSYTDHTFNLKGRARILGYQKKISPAGVTLKMVPGSIFNVEYRTEKPLKTIGASERNIVLGYR